MQLEILLLTLNGTRIPSIEIISHWQSSLDKRFSQCCPLEGTLESINTLKNWNISYLSSNSRTFISHSTISIIDLFISIPKGIET